MMKVLVTGANGFIGRHLVRQLIARRHAVRALVLPGEAVPEEWQERVEIVRGDVSAAVTVQTAMRERDAVFHLAAVVSERGREALFRRVTVEGTRHVLEAAASCGAHAVLLSSVTVYGDCLDGQTCDEEYAPGVAQGPYGRSKQAQENIALELAASRQLKVTILRAGCVFGPGSALWVDSFVPLLRKRVPCLIGGGRQNAGLCYVENLVALMLLVLQQPGTAARIYNANDGNEVSWRQYLNDLAQIAGAPPPRSMPRAVAQFLARGNEFVSQRFPALGTVGLMRESLNLLGARQQVPIERARRELGFAPPVSYEAAMRQLAPYVRRRVEESRAN